MLATKTFIGQRLDMEHYRGVSMDRTVEVFDSDDVAYDLGDSQVYFEFFAKAHGKSLETFEISSTSNEVVFDGETLDYRTGFYFHECYQLTDSSPEEKVLLFYGVSEMI